MITDRNDINRNAAADRDNAATPVFTTGQGAPFIARPNEILNDPALGAEEKRSILAAWLSDKYAVPDAPRWRQLENGAFVDTQDIWRALYALDDAAMHSRQGRSSAARLPTRSRQKLRWISAIRRRKQDGDDDDDPPPAPAAMRMPMRLKQDQHFDPAPALLWAA